MPDDITVFACWLDFGQPEMKSRALKHLGLQNFLDCSLVVMDGSHFKSVSKSVAIE